MSLSFFAIVNEKYLRYVVWFVYFCFRSYPGCGVRVLLSDCELDYENIKILEKMGDFKTHTITGYSQLSKQEFKTIRWIADEKFFSSYENIYITDIDFLICPEQETLEEQHLKHCRKTRLPYSNAVRPNSKRLTGLHFIQKKKYYEATIDAINKYSKLLKERKLLGYRGEEILYKIIEESELEFPTEWFRPHHGLHIGIWKSKGGKVLNLIETKSMVLGNYEEYFSFYQTLKKKDSLFKQMHEASPLEELDHMEEWFSERKGNGDLQNDH